MTAASLDISWLGALITFQVTFTELFIAATVVAATAYRYGWRSVALGSAIGALAVVILAVVLQAAAYSLALRWIDWLSALLLLGFGLYLFYEFIDGLRKKDAPSFASELPPGLQAVNAAGVTVAAWAIVAEGLEILVVWLGVSLRKGAATATAGVLIGLAVIAVTGLVLGRTGVFRKIPPPVLDGVAAVMVTAYGLYFLKLAIASSA